MKFLLKFQFCLFLFSSFMFGQVGIGTTTPEAQLDIQSSNSGLLIPRVALTSIADVTTVTNPEGTPLAESTLVYNDGTGGLSPAGFYFWTGTEWSQLRSGNPSVHIGKALVSSSGTLSITGVGFTPSMVEFIAINRVQGYDEVYRSDSNNSNDIRMASGLTFGYAKNVAGSIEQQVISHGFSGSSLNNIGTYSSSSHCIAAFYVNNNGEPIHDNGTATGGADTQQGLVSASLDSFDADGFTLNFDRFLAPTSTSPDRTNELVIIYKAYR
ncbi:hypothetical protein MG296_06355 [Flavobacteriaceae bacterium TK19130]|nr:hypothetical protein [Thermobacterium salinum]